MWPNPDDPHEPYWLEADYNKAMAYSDAMGELCDRCGTREEDWVDDRKRPLDPPLLEVEPYRCPGCEQLEIAHKDIPNDAKGVRPIIKPWVPWEEKQQSRSSV